ncbi:MAG: T9SS type A sorting domain-containing protein [Bacteroidetes bacterium]|nr:T9SS type A sorting domain-containing protein [Bacteroidota bacterium]
MSKIFFIILLLLSAVFNAQVPGDLDNTFGTGGIVKPVIGTGKNRANSVVVQNDGKLLVGGSNYIGPAADFLVSRYNTDGSLDNTFGTGGYSQIDINNSGDLAYSLVLQTDGKILVGGSTGTGGSVDGNFALCRLNANGSLDNSFGVGGKVITSLGPNSDIILSLTIQPDNKIVAVGFTYGAQNTDFAMARYNADGTLDAGFGMAGLVTTTVSVADDIASSVILQPDGKLVVGGYYRNGTYDDCVLIRYNINGTIDNTYGVNGKTLISFSNFNDYLQDMVLQTDGKIVVAGSHTSSGSFSNFALARVNTNGTLDTSFGVNGKITYGITQTISGASSVLIQPDGKIIASGASSVNATFDFCIRRYNSDGSADNTFGVQGKVMTPVGNSTDEIMAAALQSDGKLVVAGYATDSLTGVNTALARYYTGIVMSIEENAKELLYIYPNPLSNKITLQLPNDFNYSNSSVEVFDNLGKQVFISREIEQNKVISLEFLPTGLYHFKIKNDDSFKVFKILKQ